MHPNTVGPRRKIYHIRQVSERKWFTSLSAISVFFPFVPSLVTDTFHSSNMKFGSRLCVGSGAVRCFNHKWVWWHAHAKSNKCNLFCFDLLKTMRLKWKFQTHFGWLTRLPYVHGFQFIFPPRMHGVTGGCLWIWVEKERMVSKKVINILIQQAIGKFQSYGTHLGHF